jgi:hypothetical protein
MGDKTIRADVVWPIVDRKDHKTPSLFRPEALLREARRQRQLPFVAVPEICVLDPDGDSGESLKEMETQARESIVRASVLHSRRCSVEIVGSPG